MKKIFNICLGIALTSIAIPAQAQKSNSTSYQVVGEIKGLGNQTVTLINYEAGDTTTTKALKDKFVVKGNAAKANFITMYLGDFEARKIAYLYIEPGKISVEGSIDSLESIHVSGTPTNDDYMKTQRFLNPIYKRRSAIIQKLRASQQDSAAVESLSAVIKAKNDSIDNYKKNFIKEHPASDISLGYLYVMQDNLPVSVVDSLYSYLTPDLKNSESGTYISKKLAASKSVAIGQKAPDFTSSDTSGNAIKLSDFKGKYVLLEFWAHWCVPCRAQHPHLKQVYEKYKDKGFTILQYSVDVAKDEKKWKEAIVKDELPWYQASDLVKGTAPVAELYGVQPIPDSFLISPDGTILGRRLGHKELEQMLAEKLK